MERKLLIAFALAPLLWFGSGTSPEWFNVAR
jgi:hypothetical protein